MRILSAIKHDISFQFRHGFYYAYLFVSVIYIGALRFLPDNFREFSAILIIFSDPAILGFFFIGGILFLERGSNILENLFVTPLRVREYIYSKVLSLTLIAVLVSYFILIFTFGTDFRSFYVFLGVTLSSIFFTLLGFTLAIRARSLNEYIIISPLYIIIFVVPILEFFDLFTTPLFYFLPTKASLILLTGIFEKTKIVQVFFAVIILTVWNFIAYHWVINWFNKYIIMKIGGNQ